MTSKQRRPNAGIPGAKALIATAAVAATVGGWAAFSNANATSYQSTPTAAVSVAQAASSNYTISQLQLTPLPTLVPTVNIVINSVPTATQPAAQSSQTNASSAAQPTATAVPATSTDTPVPATDTPAPTDTPVVVVQRPQTVTTTRSSRRG